jgi:hypothetical protein
MTHLVQNLDNFAKRNKNIVTYEFRGEHSKIEIKDLR